MTCHSCLGIRRRWGSSGDGKFRTFMTRFSCLCAGRIWCSSGDDLSGANKVKLYSYNELRMATNDFSRQNKIGVGGFGSVYMGQLKDGQFAAIKVLSSDSRQGVREFLTEIQVISDVHHENLVDLLGCCVDGIHRILIYNYLENGSLDRTLLGRRHDELNFDWETRVKICIGVARGLTYLHEEVTPHVVHRDIKASNILLDKDLSPKISDFGLAKFIPSNMTHVSTRVAGTVGYLAPEYAVRGQLTPQADIYSFGVLLIEIVSGRCHTNTKLPREEKYILDRAWQLYEKNDLVSLVDYSLEGVFDSEQACRFLRIGLLCTQDSPKLRPLMSTVVLMLTGEKEVDETTITKPGMISNFMDMNTAKTKADMSKTSSVSNSSISGTMENSTVTSVPSLAFTSEENKSTLEKEGSL